MPLYDLQGVSLGRHLLGGNKGLASPKSLLAFFYPTADEQIKCRKYNARRILFKVRTPPAHLWPHALVSLEIPIASGR